MHIRDLSVVIAALLGVPASSLEAQRTGDRAQLVFTISGAYIQSRGLWTVPNQLIADDELSLMDNFVISRSIKRTLSAGLSGMYYPGEAVGFTADAFLLGLGYDDACRITPPVESSFNQHICDGINDQERSAAAVTLSVGAVARAFSREMISPFARANVGLLFSNQSSVLTQGFTPENALFTIYEDSKRTRVSPSLALGIGATTPLSRGYHLRWEVRDNIVGLERVTGPVATRGLEPPHDRVYNHITSVLIGIDVVLERSRGRRY